MKALGPIMIAVFFLAMTGAALADCGKDHGKGSYHGEDPHHGGKISGTAFTDMDADQSGAISYDEFKAVFPNTTQAGFKMLDQDENGELSQDEWQAFKDAHKGMGGYHKKMKPETT